MIIDAQLALSQSQAVTASAPSTNTIDLGANRDIGVSGGLQLLVKVDQAAAAAGAATVNFQLQCAVDSGFTVPVTVEQTDALPVASLKQGFAFFMPLPIGLNKRYVRMNYLVSTGPLTAGAFTAEIVAGVQSAPTYPAPYQA